MTVHLDAALTLLANLSAIPDWPDDLGLENMRTQRRKSLELDVCLWRESVEKTEEFLGGDDDIAPGEYAHAMIFKLAIHVSGEEAAAKIILDTLLEQAGVAIDADRLLGGTAQDVIPLRTDFDFDNGSDAGPPFQSATVTLQVDYCSTNPIL